MQDAVPFSRAGKGESGTDGWLDALASRAADGDRGAFEAIYHETIDEIFAYVAGQLRNRDVAEDLAANIFLKAWSAAPSYRGANKYRRWLFAIAHNELRDYWRKNRPGFDVSDGQAGEELAVFSDDDGAEAERQVFKALRVLNEEQRKVVVLRFFSELSHAEIAAVLGKREGAVRAQLLRALRQMRKVMSDATP